MSSHERRSFFRPEGNREYPPLDLATRAELSRFQVFVQRYAGHIDQLVRGGRQLDRLMYTLFYAQDVEFQPNGFGREGDSVRREYDEEVEDMVRDVRGLIEKQEKSGMLMLKEAFLKENWLYLSVHGGLQQERVGRMYFNIHPEALPSFYMDVVDRLLAADLSADAKIPLKMTDADIKRFDKMIVYFNEQNERALVEMVQILYHENDTVFFAPGARFGAAVPDSSGRPMRGVAFGEDPGISHESFGGIRAKILAEVYTRALSEKISFNATPAIVRLFQDACRAHHVDPSHAAFNDDKKTFPYIRSLQRAIERASSR
jgi:hypothetical protein